MPETQHRGAAGSALVLLLVVGFVAMFWWVIVAALGVLLLWGLALYASRCLDAREDARIALAARPISRTPGSSPATSAASTGNTIPADVEQATSNRQRSCLRGGQTRDGG